MQKIDITSPVTAVIDIPAGRVKLTAAGRAGAVVDVRPANPASRRDTRMAEQVTAEYAGGVLRVMAPAGNRLLGPSGTVDVIVQLPAGSRADVRTSRGDITVDEAAAGSLALRTEDGSISVTAAAGVSAALDAGTSYGRVHNALRNSAGIPALTIRATTARGDITARSR